MAAETVIRAEGLWKHYGTTLSAELRRMMRPRRAEPPATDDRGLWALRDVGFEVRRGEVFGVIGRNGAGKSTLLKVLAGVSPPTHGRLEVRGRVFPMIELNAGMNSDLTGRQNVHVLGAVMGFAPDEIVRRLPEIEAFCELGEWFDRPVWMYSSGMLARLGFAVAVNVDADILLVDEVLAVGDLPFQRKCFAKIDALYRGGAAVVFVSHSLRMVERLCTRALYLDQGRTVCCGPSQDVISQYQLDTGAELLEERTTATAAASESARVEHLVRIREVELVDENGRPGRSFETGEALTIRIHYESMVETARPIVGVGLSQEQVYVTGFSNELANEGLVLRRGIGTLTCRLPRLTLLTGLYNLSLKIRAADGGTLGGGANLVYFSVNTPASLRRAHEYGYVMMDVEWGEGQGSHG